MITDAVRAKLFPLRYPDDVAVLRGAAESRLGALGLSDWEIQSLYERWSEDEYCASWLGLSDDHVAAFVCWLEDLMVAP